MALPHPTHQPVTPAVGLLKGDEVNKAFLISLLMIFSVACTPQNSVPSTTPTALPVSPTPTVTPAPTETSPPEIIPTLASTPTLPDQNLDQILDSPKGEFIAKLENAYGHPAFDPQVIKIFDKNGLLLWEIPYQHEIATYDPHPGLTTYGWSKDSTYFYFYYDFHPDGGDFAFWWDGFDLQRINVQNGKIGSVISGDRAKFVAFAFSPDESQIAYAREQDNPSIIFIRNLSTGTEKTANVIFPEKNYVRVGYIRWSPSGKELAFHTETRDGMVQTIYLDLSTMKQKVIREYELFLIDFQGWTSDGKLEFREFKSYWDTSSQIVHVNPKTDVSVVIGTPTPGP